jgi:hypothetical protein
MESADRRQEDRISRKPVEVWSAISTVGRNRLSRGQINPDSINAEQDDPGSASRFASFMITPVLLKNSFGVSTSKKQSVWVLYKRFSRTADTFLVVPFLQKRSFSTATPDYISLSETHDANNLYPDAPVRLRSGYASQGAATSEA